jgi:hypothetical protein
MSIDLKSGQRESNAIAIPRFSSRLRREPTIFEPAESRTFVSGEGLFESECSTLMQGNFVLFLTLRGSFLRDRSRPWCGESGSRVTTDGGTEDEWGKECRLYE